MFKFLFTTVRIGFKALKYTTKAIRGISPALKKFGGKLAKKFKLTPKQIKAFRRTAKKFAVKTVLRSIGNRMKARAKAFTNYATIKKNAIAGKAKQVQQAAINASNAVKQRAGRSRFINKISKVIPVPMIKKPNPSGDSKVDQTNEAISEGNTAIAKMLNQSREENRSYAVQNAENQGSVSNQLDGITQAVNAGDNTLSEKVDSVSDQITGVNSNMKSISEVIEKVRQGQFKSVFDYLNQITQNVQTLIENAHRRMPKPIKFMDILYKVLKSEIAQLGRDIGIALGIFDLFKKPILKLAGWFKDIGVKVKDAVVDISKRVGAKVKESWESTKAAVSDVWVKTKSIISTTFEDVKGFISSAFDKFKAFYKRWMNILFKPLDPVITFAKTLFEGGGFKNAVKEAVKTLIDPITSFFDVLKNQGIVSAAKYVITGKKDDETKEEKKVRKAKEKAEAKAKRAKAKAERKAKRQKAVSPSYLDYPAYNTSPDEVNYTGGYYATSPTDSSMYESAIHAGELKEEMSKGLEDIKREGGKVVNNNHTSVLPVVQSIKETVYKDTKESTFAWED